MIRRCSTIDDLYHKGYADLAEGECDVGQVDGFRELYDHIVDCQENNSPMRGCTLPVAVANAAILDAALVSAGRGGLPVEPRYPSAKGD
jgi:hypothetical protein